MKSKNIEDFYPLSPMQQGMLFHSLLEPDSSVYIEQVACSLKGSLNLPAFQSAWEQLVQRHAILRTGFIGEALKEPVQVVHKQVSMPVTVHDWREFSEDELEGKLAALQGHERLQGFTLSKPPLMRLTLVQTGPQSMEFFMTFHHLLMDGWSMPLVLQEFLHRYESLCRGRVLNLPPARPYRDYITRLRQQDLQAAQEFWMRYLEGFTSPTPLVIANPVKRGEFHPAERPDEDEPAAHIFLEEETWLSLEDTATIQAFARAQRLTLSSLVHAAWALLLSRYNAAGGADICSDIVFGTTVSGRPADLPGAEGMIGLFINTLPARFLIDEDLALIDWLHDVQGNLVRARQFEYTPLYQIQSWSQAGAQPLFESLLVFENFPTIGPAGNPAPSGGFSPGLLIDNVRSVEQTNYPLNLIAGADERLMLKLLYDARIFDSTAIRRMLGHLQSLLRAFARQPSARLYELLMLTTDELNQLLVGWNDTQTGLIQDIPVHHTIERIAERFPDTIALCFLDQSLTYAQLNHRANQLAHYLRKCLHRSLGSAPDILVAICLDRSFEMIVSALAVLKAGAAFLPLDPANPTGRNAFTLQDSHALALITSSAIARTLGLDSLSPGPSHIIYLEDVWGTPSEGTGLPDDADIGVPLQSPSVQSAREIRLQPGANPPHLTSPAHPAYVIFTSGSTGRPKGVIIPHRGLSNIVQAYVDDMRISPGTRVLQIFSFCFDGSLIEIFPCLCAGGELVMADAQTMKSALDIHRILQSQEIQLIIAPPSLLAVLPERGLPCLQTVVSGGERCSQEIAARWSKRSDAPGCRFFNAYGPTETSIASHWYQVEDLDALRRVLPARLQEEIPIGHPVTNMQAFVLDHRLRPASVGVPGELFITGVGLALGYLNRPDLTAERFIPNPFHGQGHPTGPSPYPFLYRTGDLVLRLPDGNLIFLGRVDQQVKLRGYRIELGEIESALGALPEVAQAVVLLMEDHTSGESAPAGAFDPHLAAWIIPTSGSLPTAEQLRSGLNKILPDYMLPSEYIMVDEFPLTASGKVDRKKLQSISPGLGGGRVANRREFSPPTDPLEQALVRIWEEILNVHPVGVRDNFFELGGHSLLAVRLIGRVQQELRVELPLVTVFKHPTIRELANELRQQDGSAPLSLLLPLQPDGNRLPLYFVHPSGGSVHWYLELSHLLGKDQPFYGIQARGLNAQSQPHDSIEAMAAHYLVAIRSFQPHGPYLLGSWSMGVVVAYEMACQLLEAGEQVDLLAILDQGPELPFNEPEDQAAYLVETFGKQISLSLDELRTQAHSEQITTVWQAGQSSGFILPEITLENFRTWVNIMTAHTQAWRRYQPRLYAGRITLFKAMDEPRDARLAPDLGWSRLAAGGVEIVEVHGDHLSMIHDPHVIELAGALREQLDVVLQPV